LADSPITEVCSALKHRGFIKVGVDDIGHHIFVGSIASKVGAIELELKLIRPSDLPEIRLLKIPEKLKPIAPHINSDGALCYAAKGSIALDIFDWPRQILACVDRANQVLNQILEGERVQDLADEFYAYWYGPQCLLDLKSFQSQTIHAASLKSLTGKAEKWFVLSESLDQTKIKLAAFGYTIDVLACAGCVVTTTAEPMPLLTKDKWPPRNVSELLIWQRKLDRNCAVKLTRRLKELAQDGYKRVIVLFKSPTSHYAAAVMFSDVIVNKTYKKSGNIFSGLFESTIFPLSTIRIDGSYVTERNQPERSNLSGKKIILMGCGTIGGYLAELLVKAGAGIKGGMLVLNDPDYINAGNLGRHRLGFNTMFDNKASALVKELTRSMPTANIVSNTLDARELNLNQFDLIINATGEQSLSDELSFSLNKSKENFRPIIHCWIEGAGIAVRTMFQDDITQACYRCLTSEDRAQIYPATTEPYPTTMAGHGCESLFVPFSANVSVFAAALAAEHILDWINNRPQPRLRTMVIDRQYKSDNLNVDPIKQPYCRACAI
jgi:molybdopterin/thiamine biosynthesis adenylyltransferase